MLRSFLFLTFVLTHWQLSAKEEKLTGQILNENGSVLSYANIGIVGTSIGTVSDLEGDFSLFLKSSKGEGVLQCSSIGYENQEFKLSEINFQSPLIITLKQATFLLDEVVVTPGNRKYYSKGKDKTNTDRRVNFSISTSKNQNLGSEIGRRFKFKREAILQNFKFYVNHNDFAQVKFRINIYGVSNDLPSQRINRENILIELVDRQKGWIEVDLSGYEIVVSDDVIMGVEWVEHSPDGKLLSLPMIFPSFGSAHYYKYGSVSDWKKYGGLSTAMQLGWEE